MASYEGHATKRQRTDVGGRGVQSGSRDRFEDPHKPPPSRVVHVRGLSDGVMDADLVEAMQHFGTISFVYMMPRKGQALVEFEDMEAAKACVEYTQSHPDNVINVGGVPALFNFSTSQRINRPGEQEHQEETPNNVLLITVTNPRYPITTSVMHTICKLYGQVVRIVIFKKNGVQAMVEMDSIASATEAKLKLHGCDIYAGCCTLRVEYARPKSLTVHKNDSETWDYTNQSLNQSQNRGPALLDDPPEATYNGPTVRRGQQGPPGFNQYGNGMGEQGFDQYGMQEQRGPAPPRGRGGPMPQHYQDQGYPPQHPGRGYPQERGDYSQQQYGGYGMQEQHGLQPPPQTQPGNGSPVVMIYGMEAKKMNCDRLFNLLCLYGNVMKIKYLKSKPGCAMAEMGDALAVERAVTNLSNIDFFDKTIQLGFSRQMFLAPPGQAGELPDGTPSFMDYSQSRNNRFTTSQAASKNRIHQPSKVLHFFNAHPESTAETIKQIFLNVGVDEPVSVKMFESKSERNLTGLVEWPDKQRAVEALIMANHTTMENPSGRYPYTFKLCFSNALHAN
ncbi:heterogeneous nuclear ribonucleoprotein L-like isoform X2 [Amphiura filiformis]|uniref:heterogeneous nuclear ribonucleoprotein L-like isoform X2 n=1 Tax=Amphiura filiformis TaxID=82378 RepID=UPI003B212E11